MGEGKPSSGRLGGRVRDYGREAILVQAAMRYVRRGFAPVPVPQGEKGPILRDWQHLRVTTANALSLFQYAGNIGLILGPASGDLVDVDLDSPEARELAAEYLPPTGAVTGRSQSPRSHWWYFCPGIASTRHQDPVTRASIIELRGEGAQTLVGPSIHPSGDHYGVLAGVPARVTAETLVAAVAAIAQEVIRRRHGDLAVAKGSLPTDTPTSHPTALARPGDREHTIKRAQAYLGKLPAAISGHGGHNATFWAAIVLVHGFELSESDAMRLLLQEYNPRCDPPWTERELAHKVRDAASKPHKQPRGWLLA